MDIDELSEDDPERGLAFIDLNEKRDDVLLTPWSIVHFFSGAALKGLNFKFWPAFMIHGLYEYKDFLAHPKENYNSPINSAGDQTVAMLGWLFTRRGDQRMFLAWLVSFGIAMLLKENKTGIG